jgi:nitrogenase molybdenum-iron protein NifN
MTGSRIDGKVCVTNPLKLSPALGGALAFLGIDRCLPLLHGAQGCTAFALVLAVRHFREAIPLQTTAMDELSTILGGADNVEQAIANIQARARPRVIGLLSTALTETRDEDIGTDLRRMRERHPEWSDLDVVYASTPDFAGSLQDGWGRAVRAIVEQIVEPPHRTRTLRQVNLLAGSHLTPGDVEALKETIEALGLRVIALPDLSASLDGFVPENYTPTSAGGTGVDEIRRMGRSVLTLAIGEQMRAAAVALQRATGVPFTVFDRLVGLESFDAFVAALIEAGGASPPEFLCRRRSRLIDAMLDGHFYFSGRRAAIAGEADLVLDFASFLAGMGCRPVVATVASGGASQSSIPADRVLVGDLDDFEQAIVAAGGCDLIVASSHAQPLAARLGVPLIRAGFPVYDRLGVAQQASVGYGGSRELIWRLANVLIERTEDDHDAVARSGRHRESADVAAIDAPASAG